MKKFIGFFKKTATLLLFSFVIVSCGGDGGGGKRIEKGYTSDPDYSPTFSEDGEYHNNGTGDRQIQYQGSREQQNDLEAIDRYMQTHPGF